MMENNEVTKTLADHESRLAILESILRKPISSGKVPQTNTHPTLPQHILKLRNSGFFAEPRTADDVHKKLIPTYHSEPDRIAMALLRLASKKELRKSTKKMEKRSYLAYVW
ncbi:MAG: hypothetical protein ABTQ25_17320 [Nitrosomonas ureae]